MAVGLGSMDMPVPSVAQWEWLNWKFPRPVYAGDTIYARWTLTQKRPPVGRAATAIVVWRVDVHTADGAMCAEGEVGANVTRNGVAATGPVAGQEPATTSAATSRRRRRRRTTPTGAAAKPGTDGAVPIVDAVKDAVTAVAAVAAAPAQPATAERTGGGARRRRRRRPAGSTAARNGDAPAPVAAIEVPAPPPSVSATVAVEAPNTLSRVIRRLRRT